MNINALESVLHQKPLEKGLQRSRSNFGHIHISKLVILLAEL